jgi:TRAP-type mannitol/chloroaromatic compound transport system permease small subunit
MSGLLALSRAIDRVTHFCGFHVRWLVLAAVLVSAINAIIRKAFDISSNAWLELQALLFGAVFLLAAAYTLQKNAHVRIDVVSSRLSQKTRNWIDLLGHIFMLVPLCLILLWLSGPYALDSLLSNEGSANAGGLIVWPSKLLIFMGFLLLMAQAVSEIIKKVNAISSGSPPEAPQSHGDAEQVSAQS